MAFTYGFYNALNNDRTYNAYQFSTLFDGIIVDGVFETIGQHFAVTAGTGMSVNVGTGRAWFNHTWNENDSVMPLNLPASDLNRARYDAIVLEVGDPNTDRTNTIKVVSGTPAVNPVKPTLNRGASGNSGVDTSDETDPPWQHALAYVLVPAGSESVSASNIEIVVGMNETPFVTGPLETRSIDELFNQWDAQFTTWFNNLKAQLTDNVVTNLQAQIDKNAAAIEGIKEKTDQIEVKTVVKTEIFTESGTFINTFDTPINVSVILFGGGGGGDTFKGGGGGHMATWSGVIEPTKQIPVVIGPAGKRGENGGTTSFGTYASANGGEAGTYFGGNGGSGGGCSSTGNQEDVTGGNASYGGGGGASGTVPRKGGNGGVYGGGGGGSGTFWNTTSTYTNGGAGGTGGVNGGNGGKGGGYDGPGASGGNGVNTSTLSPRPEFYGNGAGGNGGNSVTIGSYLYGGGGGGGGGYGGNGGDASPATKVGSHGGSGASGGGGGYGADGGNASTYLETGSGSSRISAPAASGGGGGYGGRGGNGRTYVTGSVDGYSGEGYGAGGGGGSGSTIKYGSHGGGGGGYGKGISSTAKSSGNPGICVIRYSLKIVNAIS